MNPVVSVLFVGGVLGVGAYVVAVLDRAFGPVSRGPRDWFVWPIRRAAFLAVQRRTETERPDAEAWILAPALLAALAAAGLTAVPVTPSLAVADVSAGVVLFGAAMIIVMVAVFLQGWSPNSLFPLIGAYRFAAMALSFGIPFSLVVLTTAIPAESLSVGAIVASQEGLWNVVRQPLGLPVYLVTGAAVAFWGPFRIPEGTDLAGGAVLEASGSARAVWRIARAGVLVTLSVMGAAIFLGGHLGPVLPGWAWTALKTLVLLAVFVWSGHAFARMRVERFVWFGWVVLLPVALVDVFASGILAL